MSPIVCRIILVDHASRRSLWGTTAPAACPDILTPLDPRPFAVWDVSALAVVFRVGHGQYALADVLAALPALRHCHYRLCYSTSGDDILIILEKKERTPVDVPAMRAEIEALTAALPAMPPPAASRPVNGAAPGPVNDAAPSGTASHGGVPVHQRLPAPRAKYAGLALPPGIRAVVLVEDELLVRSVCRRILQAHFLVFEVDTSLDALALSDLLPYPLHLLVSDLSLPLMDGRRLAQLWLQRRPSSRVLILSGHAQPDALPPGIGFLQKPFLADELLREVDRLLTPGNSLPTSA